MVEVLATRSRIGTAASSPAYNLPQNAVINRDFPVIQGFTLVIAMFFLVTNIAADMLYSLIDPRIRY